MWSARRLMTLYISMNFLESISTFSHEITIVKFQRGITPKGYRINFMVLVLCTSSDDAIYFYEVS